MSLIYLGKKVLLPQGESVPLAGEGPCRDGTALGDYRVVREIGRGGMGIVYEAEQLTLKRPVALKVLPRVLGIESAGLKRFQREARIAATLRHTNIVPIHDFGLDQGVAYYSMDLIEGPSLDRVIADLRRGGPIPASRRHLEVIGGPLEDDFKPFSGSREPPARTLALAFARKAAWLASGVAEGLHVAHQRGIIHRDIKPANLMLSSQGQLVITDFGVARMDDPGSRTTTGRSLGTPHYMSPEQTARMRVPMDHRTDIYSLGVTLFELLTLSLPFTAERPEEVLERIVNSDPPPMGRLNPHLPRDLEAIVLRAMEKNATRRYQTALELS